MADDRWLNQLPAMVGGVFQCAQKLDTWKQWDRDEGKSEDVNLAEA